VVNHLSLEYWSAGVLEHWKISNFKHQITNKSQIPIINDQNKKQVWNFEFWCILETDELSKGSRKNWARLIRKIYEVDPLVCQKCKGQMRIIAFIEEQEIVKKILKHLGLYLVRSKPPARAPPRDLWVDQ
jgi:hypothetical protein